MFRVWPALLLAALAVAASTSIASAAANVVVFGETLLLSGRIPSGASGASVRVLAQPYGSTRFRHVGTVRTRAAGRWSYEASPRIHTVYRAEWRGVPSRQVVVDVAPRLELDVDDGVVHAKAIAARSFSGRYVVLQLRTPGSRWRAVQRLVLDARSTARARQALPEGRSDLRLVMPRRQAAPGYVASVSSVFTFINRDSD